MDTYSLLREFADSWVLLFLFAVFLVVIVWAWRPGSRKVHDEAANSIFRNEKKPAGTEEVRDVRAPTPRSAKEA